MTRLGILGVTSLALAMLASDALAQRRGGAVSGGMRGAVVGGMVGGSEGAATGAKVGVVTGATRAAINRETQARTQYQATTEYQNAQHSNFNEAPPEVLGTTAAGTAKKAKRRSRNSQGWKAHRGDYVSFRLEPKDRRQLHLGRQRGWTSLLDARHPRRGS